MKRRRHLKWASSDRVSDEQLWEMRIEGKETTIDNRGTKEEQWDLAMNGKGWMGQ